MHKIKHLCEVESLFKTYNHSSSPTCTLAIDLAEVKQFFSLMFHVPFLSTFRWVLFLHAGVCLCKRRPCKLEREGKVCSKSTCLCLPHAKGVGGGAASDCSSRLPSMGTDKLRWWRSGLIRQTHCYYKTWKWVFIQCSTEKWVRFILSGHNKSIAQLSVTSLYV